MQFCQHSANSRRLFSYISKGVYWRCCYLDFLPLLWLGCFPGTGSALPYQCEASTLRLRMEGIIAVANAHRNGGATLGVADTGR
jgi:hypothetical protein